MKAVATFDLHVTEDLQPVFIPETSLIRHMQHLCLHGKDFIQVTYDYEHGDHLHEHCFVVLSDGSKTALKNIRFVGAVSVNQAAMLVYRVPVPTYEKAREGWANYSVTQNIHFTTISEI